MKLPRNMEDAKGLGKALSNYTDEYFLQVLLGFVVIYILYLFGIYVQLLLNKLELCAASVEKEENSSSRTKIYVAL